MVRGKEICRSVDTEVQRFELPHLDVVVTGKIKLRQMKNYLSSFCYAINS